MGQQIVQVDAFTDKPFQGNPAAVCVLPEARSDEWMQRLAREMNLSETAFLVERPDGAYDLRWFTPAVEVALCGHATLASAHVLWESGRVANEQQVRFFTKSGVLTADQKDNCWIELDFPATPEAPAPAPPGLIEALGVHANYVGKNLFDYLVEVGSEQIVRDMQPDFGRLAALPVRGIIVTSRSADERFDFVSRFFAPASGVNEDPVTGSAHCCLAPFWAARLCRPEMLAYQASARGGVVRVTVSGDRVKLGGQAVTVMRGELSAIAVESGGRASHRPAPRSSR